MSDVSPVSVAIDGGKQSLHFFRCHFGREKLPSKRREKLASLRSHAHDYAQKA